MRLASALFTLALLVLVPAGRAAEAASLNFRDADLRSVIESIAQFSGTNIVIDPRVTGTVTVFSPVDVPNDQLLPMLDSILSVYGYATVPAGNGVLKVVPDDRAAGEAPLVRPGAAGPRDRVVTRIIAVRHLPASSLVPSLREMLPRNAVLTANDAANALILSSTAANVERLAGVVASLDHPAAENTVVVPLYHASASEVLRILTSVIAVPGRTSPLVSPQPRVAADARTNSIVLTVADRAERDRLLGIIDDLDKPRDDSGGTEVVYLRYGRAENIAGLLQPVAKQIAGGIPGDEPAIQADPHTNSLIITGSPEVQRMLRDVVARLDIRRAQVMVEAIIAEVSDDTASELGIQFSVSNGNIGGVLSTGSTGTNISGYPFTNAPAVLGGTLAIGAIAKTVPDLGAVIRALREDSASNILSTPSLATLDNEEAEIIVGQNVPFLTGQYSTSNTSTALTPFQTIERRDVGLRLKILPQINEGGTVRLDIFQEVSSINNTNVGAVDLITDRRSIRTSVQVPSGDLVVIGGLIDDTVHAGTEKVPGLGDIPLVGELFTNRSSTALKRNLMIFIRPQILDSDALTRDVAHTKYNMLRSLQERFNAGDRRLAGAPLMPPLPY